MLANSTHFLTRFTGVKTSLRRRAPLALVAAAVSRAGVAAGVERATTRAARDRVGVVHRKAATHQAVHEIDLGALDVLGTDRVHKQPYATDVTDGVAFLGPVLESHTVRHAGAAAWLDEHAKTHLRASLLLQKVTQLREGGVGNADQLGVLFDHFLSHVSPIIRPPVADPVNFDL